MRRKLRRCRVVDSGSVSHQNWSTRGANNYALFSRAVSRHVLLCFAESFNDVSCDRVLMEQDHNYLAGLIFQAQ